MRFIFKIAGTTMKAQTGVLLVNLGTPKTPRKRDVYTYLTEFLTDPRVIDIPWISRQLLVRGVIIPKRVKSSSDSYKKIWKEEGSPLMIHSLHLKNALKDKLGSEYLIEIAMRYQNPSIEECLERLKKNNITRLIVIPLFPQYASATTGSVHQKIMELLSKWAIIPEVSFVKDYPRHPLMIDAFCDLAKRSDYRSYDHVLFSFHGLPERQLKKVDSFNHCLQQKNCCQTICHKNSSCYSAQCNSTARAIIENLHLDDDSYSIAFQSRLGKEPWLQPYTSDVISELARKGKKKVLVICPAFVCDCLETIYEIGVEYDHEFKSMGGEKLVLVEGLNDHPLWVDALKSIVLSKS